MAPYLTDTIQEALDADRTALGTWVQMNSPETCQIAGRAGYDFVIIDMEHGALSISDTASLIRAAQSTAIDAIVRTPDDDPTEIRRALDAGARGVLVPGLRTGEQARATVAATRFAPEGTRGACPCVPSMGFGTVPWRQQRTQTPPPLTWLLIENTQAIHEIDDIIAARPDAVVLGPFDLAMSMGLDGDHSHRAVGEALSSVTAKARTSGVDVVYVAVDHAPQANADGVRRAARSGCRIATTFIDRSLLAHSYAEMVGQLKDCHRAGRIASPR